MTEEIIKCVKGESCIHCGSTYCRFVDEVNELKQENKALKDNNNQLQAIIDDGRAENKRFREENKDLKKQIESDKGLITVGGKQQYEYLQRIDKLEQENKELKDTADTMLMANDIKKQDIDSLREANDRLEQENKELKELNKKICEDWEKEIKVYWNTLEEIREIAMGIMDDDIDEGSAYYDADQIINKTNEVLNG